MKVLVTVSCSKLVEADDVESAEINFRKEVNKKLDPEEIHSVVGMEVTGDDVLNITVRNCDDKCIDYKWPSIEAFVDDMESDNEVIPMLDDMIIEVNTSNHKLQLWCKTAAFKRITSGITVDDLLDVCKQEFCM